jgi:HPt (histidine-containing phosphotransfer) domain-containing protein
MSTHTSSVMNDTGRGWTFPEALQQLLGAGEEEFLAELIEVFKSQTRIRMRLLREAVENGRLGEARAQAHAIKGGSSQVGADRLAAACFEIENGAGGIAETAAQVTEAEFLFEEACRLIALPTAQVERAASANVLPGAGSTFTSKSEASCICSR